MTAPSREELELYVMGEHDDPAAIEAAIANDKDALAFVASDADFEVLLLDAGEAAFCPGCGELARAKRCDACGAALRPGGYTVERVLVGNEHGRMYVARDRDGRWVALKELAFVQSPKLSAIEAFEREAKFLRALEHPAIPRFVASFEEDTGVHVRYYLAQELVTGEPLDARLGNHWFTEKEIVDIARQVLRVLVYLQGLSPMVIHRDIKPANLLARADGSIAVVDFGAAHIKGETEGSSAVGTFGYMPIEQLAGIVDATTDPYALGASLIHLLSRREPWRILQGNALEHVNISQALAGFLGKLVAQEPRDRFPNAVVALEALERVAKGELAEPAPARTPRRSGRSWRTLEFAAAALVIAGVSAGGYALLSATREEARTPAPQAPLALRPQTEPNTGAASPMTAVRAATCPEGTVRVPGGTFQMGSPAGLGEADEHPQHAVTLSPYCIDKTEVTVKAYEACISAKGCTVPLTVNGAGTTEWNLYCNRRDLPDRPINCVDWNQAATYCAWAGKRLPTEAEWEYAARGSDDRVYPWGNEAPNAKLLNACGSECLDLGKRDPELQEFEKIHQPMYHDDDGWETTARVGSFPGGASPFGVLDMAGNVWEWTADWYGTYSDTAATNPQGPSIGTHRVSRGGGWISNRPDGQVRAAARTQDEPSNRRVRLGFRCAR
jgi:formylglycine-generating enzyme required for sulfatase activity